MKFWLPLGPMLTKTNKIPEKSKTPNFKNPRVRACVCVFWRLAHLRLVLVYRTNAFKCIEVRHLHTSLKYVS